MKYYVDISAFRDGDGSKERPFRHINDAAKVAGPGDEVLVAPGIYREYVNPQHAGTADAPISYISTQKHGCRLETNLYDFLGDFTCDMIHTSTLGTAFEPEQAFENPDGTPIAFYQDYHGSHRGSEVLPGPFAKKEKKYCLITS